MGHIWEAIVRRCQQLSGWREPTEPRRVYPNQKTQDFFERSKREAPEAFNPSNPDHAPLIPPGKMSKRAQRRNRARKR